MNKSKQAGSPANEAVQPKSDGPSKISSDHFSRFLDPSVKGVELVQLKSDRSRSVADTHAAENGNANLSKDPLLSVDTRSTRLWSSLPMNSQTSDEGGIQRYRSGGEWGDMLDMISRRKTQALAPEHFENMWTKGRNYIRNEGENRFNEQVPQGSSHENSVTKTSTKAMSKTKENVTGLSPSESTHIQSGCTDPFKEINSFRLAVQDIPNHSVGNSYEEDGQNVMCLEDLDSGSDTSYTSEDEENNRVTGLDSPGTKVWDGKKNRNMAVSHIHHPLEIFESNNAKKTAKGHVHYSRLHRNRNSRKRSRPSNHKVHVWQEVERTSFLSGDGQDILGSSKGHANDEDFSDDSDTESLGRVHSGAAASSSAPSTSVAESRGLVVNSLKNSLAVDSFYKLRCEVQP